MYLFLWGMEMKQFPGKILEYSRRLGAKNLLFLVLAMLLVTVLLLVNFAVIYSNQKDKLVLTGQINTDKIEVDFKAQVTPLIDLVKVTAYKINFLDDNSGNTLSAAEVKIFITNQIRAFEKNSAMPITGIYSFYNGEFVNSADWVPVEGYKPEERPWYVKAVEHPGQIIFIEPYVDAFTQKITMTVAVTLNNKQNVMGVDLPLDRIQESVVNLSRDDGYEHMIVNDQGLVISHSDVSYVGKNYDVLDGKISSVYEYVVSNIHELRNNSYVVVEFDGVRYVVDVRDVGGHWYVVGIANADDYFVSLKIIFTVSVLLILLVLSVVVVVFHNLIRKQRDIEKLDENMLMVAEIYDFMYEISLSINTCRHLCSRTGDGGMSVLGKVKSDAQEYISKEMNNLADDVSKNVVQEFVDLRTLSRRMTGRESIILEFLNRDGLWSRARFIASQHKPSADLDKILLMIENIDAEKREREKLIYLSETDHLTGILNRRSGESRIRTMISNMQSGMYALFDADKFKSVNDNYGHDVGDKVIIAIAECLRKTFRNYDVVMRLGGDEFAVFAVAVTDRDTASELMKRFFNQVDSIYIEELKNFRIRLSVGISFFDVGRNSSLEKLYREADFASYESKKTEGNSMTFFENDNYDDYRR